MGRPAVMTTDAPDISRTLVRIGTGQRMRAVFQGIGQIVVAGKAVFGKLKDFFPAVFFLSQHRGDNPESYGDCQQSRQNPPSKTPLHAFLSSLYVIFFTISLQKSRCLIM